MTDPTDNFCLHAIFAIEALKALEAGCPEDDTEFTGEINVAIGLRQMLELAVDSYGLGYHTNLRVPAARALLEKYLTAARPAPSSFVPGDEIDAN